jgi:ABC-type sugar transport system substrate-binding protein
MVQEIQDEEVMRHNLNNVQIQTDVELKLRTAGIKVFAIDSKPLDEKRNPVLYVYINFLKVSEGMYAFNAYVKLAQRISLVRNPHTIAYATTWETGGIGAIGISKVSQIRGEIKDFVDEFINAYSAVQTR